MTTIQGIKRTVLSSAAIALCLGLVVPTTATAAAILAVDLSDSATPINSGTISDGTNTVTFIFDKQQPSGTGVLDPFVRIQENGTEQGYNTTLANQGAYPFQEKSGVWTHDLAFSSMQAINGNYNFVLDIGEPVADNANQGQQSLLSLDGIRLYATNTPGQSSNSVDANGNANGIVGTLLWDMDMLADNYILLDANRDGNPGNGVSDMLMQVPTSVFSGVTSSQYIILWSRFGLQNASNAGSESFGTFEEWAHLTVPTTSSGSGGGGGSGGIPEPGTLSLFGAAILGGFFYSRRRQQSNV